MIIELFGWSGWVIFWRCRKSSIALLVGGQAENAENRRERRGEAEGMKGIVRE